MSMCVGLLPTNLDGAAVSAIGREMRRFRKERERRVQWGPRCVSRTRIIGEKIRPPIPAPELGFLESVLVDGEREEEG
jgi:hypothetical protein